MNATSPLPRIALTLGDPAGVGPELAVKLLAKPETTQVAEVYVLADAAELEAAAKAAGVRIPLSDTPRPGFAVLVDDHSAPAEPIPVRQVSQEAGARTLHQLTRAVAMANAGEVEAILFTPLNKTSLKLGGMKEEDELRWFAKELNYDGTTSELNVLPGLWTARVTSHIPISEVAERITAPNVTNAIRLLHSVLADSGLEDPRIAVCALNPHAGENGNFGREEIDHIAPGIEEARGEGINASGPFPSDTVFLAAKRGDFDGVVTMYHDQGQIAMKLIGFDRGVTIQGGLPIVIATPAHGTAFDIVGRNIANLGATEHAFELAVAVAPGSAPPRRPSEMTTRGITIGISTKMYLGYETSKVWLGAVTALASASGAVQAGRVRLFVAPTFPILETTLGLTRGTPIQIAAQNASDQDAGALTGEVSPAFLAEMGVELVEIGHAERRRLFAEDDGMVAGKVAAAQRNGLQPLLCVGEEVRAAPEEAARTCLGQIRRARISAEGPRPVIAYEPLWAIGTPQPAPADYVRAVAACLREELDDGVTLLYGGSAGPSLLPELYPFVDGLFLGRFAHDPRNVALILEEAAGLLAGSQATA